MKKYSFLFVSLLFIAFSCPDYDYGEDLRVDTSVMPPETQTGAGTFGYLMGEWIYVGGRYENPQNPINKKSIFFVYDEEENRIEVSVIVNFEKEISFQILKPEEGKECIITHVKFDEKVLPDLTCKITRFSKQETQVISGTFAGGSISEGRFDTVYYLSDEIE